MEQLNEINLGFSDYLLLAIILVFLHLINVIELIALKSNDEEGDRTSNLKFQATIAFIGIISTIICGLISQCLKQNWIDVALILIPLLFIFTWFIHQPRSSNFISLEKVHVRVYAILQNEISSYAERKSKFTIDDLYKDYHTIITVDILLRNFTRYSNKMNLPIAGLQELFKPLEFTKDDIEGILKNLCNKGDLILNDNYYIYKKSKKNGN